MKSNSIIKFMTSTAAGAIFMANQAFAADLPQATNAPVKVGTYDSRSIAIAFVGSPAFKQWMTPIQAEYAKAKQSGDAAGMKKIEQEMQKDQKLRHMQGFSTAPVDDVLKTIEARLPDVQKAAGVDVIISKWDQAALAKYEKAEKIDVTMRLVDEFHPSDRQRKSAIEIQKHEPISLKEAEKIDD